MKRLNVSLSKERLATSAASLLLLPGFIFILGLIAWFLGFWHNFLDQVWNMSCHRLPERSLQIAGHLLPVCARCTGLWLGAIVGAFLSLNSSAPACKTIPILWWWALVLFLVGCGDAFGRTFIGWDTPSWARLITGAALGMSAFYLAGAVIRTVILHTEERKSES